MPTPPTEPQQPAQGRGWPALLTGATLAALGGGLALARAEKVPDEALLPWRLALALAPLLGLLVTACHPGFLAWLRGWPERRLVLGGLALTAWTALLPAVRFDPYLLTILLAAAAAVLLGGAALRGGHPLSGPGLALWLLLWIPFDLRWYSNPPLQHRPWLGPSQAGYATCALLLSALAVLAWGVAGRQELGLRRPRLPDLPRGAAVLAGFAALAIPIGLATGFLRLDAPRLGPGQALLTGLGIFLTVALPEELFFRALLDQGLRGALGCRVTSLALSSLAFGLMHWNNEGDLKLRLIYFALASVAGVAYGLCWRWTGGLFAPVLVHTLVDLFWATFLKR